LGEWSGSRYGNLKEERTLRIARGACGITNAIVSLRGLIIMANSNFNEQEQNQMSNEDFLGESLRKIAKGAGFVLIGTLIGRAFGYGSRLIIARLGASDYGLVALGFAVMSII